MKVDFLGFAHPADDVRLGYLYFRMNGQTLRVHRGLEDANITCVPFASEYHALKDARNIAKIADHWVVCTNLEDAPFNQHTLEGLAKLITENGRVAG